MPIVKYTGPVFKIIVVGDSGVGKTSLLYRYSKDKPPGAGEIKTTSVCDHVQKVLDVEGTEIKLSIWDPSGTEKVRESVIPTLYRKVRSVVFVYDVASPESFANLKDWLKECQKNNVILEELPVVLLANKYDLSPIVEEEVAQEFAKQHKMMFFKTSSFIDENVAPLGDVFMYLARIFKFSKQGIVVANEEEDEVIIPDKKDLEKDSKSCCKGVEAFFKKIFWFLS